MKLLNESNLVYFSTCSSLTTKEGWLYKKGEVNRSFQKRWFVLKGNLLFYFDKPGDKEPNGVIILEGYTVELVETAVEGFTFQISFRGSGNLRKYILQAESHAVMEDWMKVITCASYDYMKLMVAELKSQLDELNSQELSNELSRCKTRADSSVDPFGQQPFVPVTNSAGASAAPISEVPAVTETLVEFRSDLEGSCDSTGSNASASASSYDSPQLSSRPRINPFDRDSHKDGNIVFKVDAFGQVPFNLESNPRPASEPNLTVPQAPARRKGKNSPKLKHSTKISKQTQKGSRKTIGDEPSTSCKLPGRTQFYQDAQLYYGDEMKPPYKQSCFTDLHTKYGEIIDRVLDSIRSGGNTVTNREATSVASSDTLIQF